jgi:hypothetical protein
MFLLLNARIILYRNIDRAPLRQRSLIPVQSWPSTPALRHPESGMLFLSVRVPLPTSRIQKRTRL